MLYRGDAASVEWVASNQSLDQAVNGWESAIGIDTEFQRTNTFYPIPGLYQVISGERVYLIDPLEISEWQPLVAVLEDESVVKVMHACSEDLELISHHLNAVPVAVFDTQLANAFQAKDFSTSYANLVAQQLGVELGKHETRSNWLQRPLTEEQIRYAREDVHYLLPLFECLSNKLRDLDRAQWFHDLMTDKAFVRGDPHRYYRSMKKAWRLDPPQLNVLQSLCAWREHKAMSEDLPRNRIIWDDHLYQFAQVRQLEYGDLIESLPRAVVRRYADELIEHHRKGCANTEVLQPILRPLTQGQNAITKALRDVARSHADRLRFADELLARKRDVEACVRHYLETGDLSPEYQGWRGQIVADEFKTVLKRLR